MEQFLTEKMHSTPKGVIRYWVGGVASDLPTLVFLPGLTADHRLFDEQLACFIERYRVLVWDAPGHAASRPFTLDFSLADKAVWLHEILQAEGITHFVLIGQSMGGYVSQSFLEQYPGEAKGFVCIDSAPLQRKYMTKAEIWMLKHTEGMYRAYPWKALLRDGPNGCAETEAGRKLMRDMMMGYEKEDYVQLTAHGYRILGEAIEADLPYRIDCPALLICGECDKAGSTKRYNRRWTQEARLPICWIQNAGHNSNTDQPEAVNRAISEFLTSLMPSGQSTGCKEPF